MGSTKSMDTDKPTTLTVELWELWNKGIEQKNKGQDFISK